MLRATARTPLKTIAGTVGLASSSVRERITHGGDGAIAGNSAQLGLGMPGASAILLVRLAMGDSCFFLNRPDEDSEGVPGMSAKPMRAEEVGVNGRSSVPRALSPSPVPRQSRGPDETTSRPG